MPRTPIARKINANTMVAVLEYLDVCRILNAFNKNQHPKYVFILAMMLMIIFEKVIITIVVGQEEQAGWSSWAYTAKRM